jgi:hypothetical protein
MEKIREIRMGFWPCVAGVLVVIYALQSVMVYAMILILCGGITALMVALAFAGVRLWGEWAERRDASYRNWCECQKLLSESTVTMIPDKHQALVRRPGAEGYDLGPAIPAPRAVPQVVHTPCAQDGAQEAVRPLLPLLAQLDRVLLIGGMGSGKSTLLKHLVTARAQQGETMIIDSHAGPDTWPAGPRVVGRGRDYEAITDCIKGLHKEMDRRYKQLSAGEVAEGAFRPVNLIIDEFTVLNKFCSVKSEISSLLCECRKVGITLCVAGQSDRVKSLGLEGEGDLIFGFEAVCYLELASDGERYGMVRMGRNKDLVRYSHPGVFGVGAVPLPSPDTPPADPQVAENGNENNGPAPEAERIREMDAEGMSVSAISKAVWGRATKENNNKVRGILNERRG